MVSRRVEGRDDVAHGLGTDGCRGCPAILFKFPAGQLLDLVMERKTLNLAPMVD